MSSKGGFGEWRSGLTTDEREWRMKELRQMIKEFETVRRNGWLLTQTAAARLAGMPKSEIHRLTGELRLREEKLPLLGIRGIRLDSFERFLKDRRKHYINDAWKQLELLENEQERDITTNEES